MPLARSFRRMSFLVTIFMLVAIEVCGAAQSDPGKAASADFFGITNLYTFHLTIPAAEYAKMDPGGPGGPGQIAGEVVNQIRRLGQQAGGAFPPGGGFPRLRGGSSRFKEVKATLEFDGRKWGEVSVRFKGNSSFGAARNSIKKSLKLDFNDTEKGRKFFGMTKLNLNNDAFDPSGMREAVSYEVFRRAGVPASRTAFAKVFLTVPGQYDRKYLGLYTAIEQVDATFLKNHFGTKSGFLIKPEGQQGLPYNGDAWSSYPQFKGKSKIETKDSDRFISFVRMLSLASDSSFANRIHSYLDVDAYLRFIAVQTALVNLDSPLRMGHNYYMYLDPRTQKINWIPWDLNMSFGGFMRGGPGGQDITDLDIHRSWASWNRLNERIMALEGAKEKYDQIMSGLIATNFTQARMLAEVESIAAVIRDAFTNDPHLTVENLDRNLAEKPEPLPPLVPTGTRIGTDTNTPRVPAPGGPGGGPPGRAVMNLGMMRNNTPPLREFIDKRIESIRLQLDGKREGYAPPESPGGLRGGGPPRPAAK